MQRYTPRRAKSNWAASNKKRVKKLIEKGMMTEFGLDAIEIAKQNGSWNPLANIETRMKIPEELQES